MRTTLVMYCFILYIRIYTHFQYDLLFGLHASIRERHRERYLSKCSHVRVYNVVRSSLLRRLFCRQFCYRLLFFQGFSEL